MAEQTILGIGQMRENFARLREEVATRTGRAMVVSGGGVLRKRAKANLQAKGLVRTGSTLRNVAIKRETSAPPGTVQYHLGVRHGRDKSRAQRKTGKLSVASSGRIVRRYEDDPYYWRFNEFGTVKTRARPALGPALADGRSEVIEAMAARLKKELDKAGST